MKVLLSWLQEFVAIEPTPGELAEILSLSGSAVERVEKIHGSGASGQGPAEGSDDWTLELDLTSNRPDCLSHYGMAREIAAALRQPLRPLLPPDAPAFTNGAEHPRVTIETPEACGRYCAVELTGVRVGPASAEIAARLRALGQRPINNIADLTNYALLEMGHPTHAFDADKIEGGELRVRWARPGETLVTLDGIERQLHGDDLVIADARRAVALAGVMGGAETAISAATRRVFLEAAWFNPLTVRRAARRHALHTDASHRFERGADPEAAPAALRLIARRAQSGGATIPPAMVDVRPAAAAAPRPIALRLASVQRILGKAVERAESDRILHSLGCVRAGATEEETRWLMPSWRHDLKREIDLIEEVARLHGYDRFPARLPAFLGVAADRPEAALRDRLRALLRAHGFGEAVTVSFADEAECRRFAPSATPVRVLNPLSEEAAILRTSSLPAMLHLLRNNLTRGVSSPRLFEIGKLYQTRPDGATGEAVVLSLGAVAGSMDFASLKGEIEAILDLFEHPELTFFPTERTEFHPGRNAVCTDLATFGQLHPMLAAEWKLPTETWLAEIHLDRPYACGPRQPHYHPPSRFPESERDFSFLFTDAVTWAHVRHALEQAPAIPHLGTLEPVETYHGAGLGEGRYSLLLRARFQSHERTLQDIEIQASAAEIVRRLTRLGGTQR